MFHFRKTTLKEPQTAMAAKKGRASGIRMTKSADDAEQASNSNQKMSSGGGLFRRNRSTESAKARAQELSTRYELSEIKDSKLNKKATHKPGVSLSSGSLWSVTPQQATKMYQESKKKVDPLLTESERKERGLKPADSVQAIHRSTTWTISRKDVDNRNRTNIGKSDSRTTGGVGRSRTWSQTSTCQTAPVSPTASIETVESVDGVAPPALYINDFC